MKRSEMFEGFCESCDAEMLNRNERLCVACATKREASEREAAEYESGAKREAALWAAYNDAIIDEPDLSIDVFRERWEEKNPGVTRCYPGLTAYSAVT